MASSLITSWQIDGETMETVRDFIFLGSKITAGGDCSHEMRRCLLLGRKAMTNLDSVLIRRHYFADKAPSSQRYGFSNSHIWMWALDYKESLLRKNWCFWTVVLEKTLESPLDCEEIKPVNPKGNQSWILIGRTDAEAGTPTLWPPDAKSWLIGKDPDAGKDWRQGENGMTEDEVVGWYHQLDLNISLSKDQELVINRETWCAAVHGVAKSQTRLSKLRIFYPKLKYIWFPTTHWTFSRMDHTLGYKTSLNKFKRTEMTWSISFLTIMSWNYKYSCRKKNGKTSTGDLEIC